MSKLCECGEPIRVKGKCKRCYMREYYQRPGVKERRREYEREYYQRPGVKERRREYQKRRKTETIKGLMDKYDLNMEEAKIVYYARGDISRLTQENLKRLLEEVSVEEGAVFTEMLMDGIPKQRGIKLSDGPVDIRG